MLPAAGHASIEAATNIVVRHANRSMLLYVCAAVIALCFVTFHSWRAVLVAVIPLAIRSILCEALMVGRGIGVDYALYLLAAQLAAQRRGIKLAAAYADAVMFTRRVVALVGVTLAAGVITWAFSPVKFQADMGILLTLMLPWNMVGALLLTPALLHSLLNDSQVKRTA